MKKIILSFLGSILLFFILSYIDEYETLILPFFTSVEVEIPDNLNLSIESIQEIKETIKLFNSSISAAYASLDSSFLDKSFMEERVSSYIVQEIKYMSEQGKIMETNMQNLEVLNVEVLSPFAVRVKTNETIVLRYLSSSDENNVINYPPAAYNMRYILQRSASGWQVASFETISVKSLEDKSSTPGAS